MLSNAGRRVLIADSSPTFRALYIELASLAGYECRSSGTLEETQHLIRNWQPNLLLLATNFSDGDGLDFCRQLKTRPDTVLLPVIVVTSQPQGALREKAFVAGALDILDRNASTTFIQERIRAALNQRQLVAFRERFNQHHFHILVVEDSPAIQSLYGYLLGQINCSVHFANDGKQGWRLLNSQEQAIDLVITDLEMPLMNGQELCHLIRSSPRFDQIPIVLVSSQSDRETIQRLLNQGANDYMTKPFVSEEFMARLNAHLRLRAMAREQDQLNRELTKANQTLEQHVVNRTREIYAANIDAIHKLAVACDYKDNNTANHINRVRHYVTALAKAVGLDDTRADDIGYSSMMHDIGKIAIPDHILNKPGPLTEDEWATMQTHTLRGAEILGEKPFFRTAREIALYHHERYDGTGYPHRLRGRDIPLSARILAVVDVYDALMSRRPYKEPWPKEQCLLEISALRGNHLDPELVEVFSDLVESGHVANISQQYPSDIPLVQELVETIL